MKKHQYHVNPTLNKWEEDHQRAMMEKMIQRARSTLPPEARTGGKKGGTGKPSPYTAEKGRPSASAGTRRNPSSGGARRYSAFGAAGGAAGGAGAVVDVKELDGLIYNRLEEILGMPLMQRAAAIARARGRDLLGGPGAKGGTPPKPPGGRRRPAWNDDWSAPHQNKQGAAAWDETAVGGGNATRAPERSSPAATRRPPTNPYASPPARPLPYRATSSPHITAGPAGSSLYHPAIATGSMQRRISTSAAAAAGDERVTLLPSPSGSPAHTAARPGSTSSRYGHSDLGPTTAQQPHPSRSHVLNRSDVSTIAALNPHAPAAQEAAVRVQGYTATAAGTAGGAGMLRSGSIGARNSRGSYGGDGGRDQLGEATLSTYGGARGHVGGSLPGVVASGVTSPTGTSKPPLTPPRASGATGGQGRAAAVADSRVADGGGGVNGQGDGEEDEYADEEFESEYEDDFEDDGEGDERGAAGQEDEDGHGDGVGHVETAAALRQSVAALNGLVQMKIEEVSRSRQLQQHSRTEPSTATAAARRSSTSSLGAAAAATAATGRLLASMSLIGADEEGDHGHHQGGGMSGGLDLGESNLMDGLQQSDLEYLARLGGADPQGPAGHHPETSMDEHPVALEAGAPAGTARAWGDRQPWGKTEGPKEDKTGLDVLRERQQREAEKVQQEREREQQGRHGDVLRQSAGVRTSGAGAGQLAPLPSMPVVHGPDADLVLLGETLSPGRRTNGAGQQMEAVAAAMAQLTASARLSVDDKKELRNQTDALYGSLMQLHRLMSGPRGNELRSPTHSTGSAAGTPAAGFTPTALSPAGSPSHASSAAAAAAAALAAAAGPSPRASVGQSHGQGHGSIGERSQARPGSASGMGGGRVGGALAPPPRLVPPEMEVRDSTHGNVGGGDVGASLSRSTAAGLDLGAVGTGSGRHVVLTPKHQLVAEDVAWMAGLVDTLSRSLHADGLGGVELPGL